jgi:hypothetical protein
MYGGWPVVTPLKLGKRKGYWALDFPAINLNILIVVNFHIKE